MWIDLIIYTPMYVTGFWSVVLLLSSGRKNRAKQFLGIFMVLAFGIYFSHALYFQNQYSAYLFFDPIYLFASLSVYPMYYWYIKLLTVESDVQPGNLKLFIPALFFSLTTILLYVFMTGPERSAYLMYFLFRDEEMKTETTLSTIQRMVFIGSRLAFMLQIFVFLILGRKLVLQYNSRIANFYSDLESKTIVWVKLLLYSFFVTSLISIVFNVIGRSIFSGSFFLLLIPSLTFSVLLFIIGFQGYMQNHTVTDLVADELDLAELTMKEYNHAQLKDRLLELFIHQKIYKEPDLKITMVSMKLQTNRTYVSNLINTEFKCTFSEFVNQYRVVEAKKRLADPSQRNYSLDYVSEASGFGSIHSFIRIFKEHEGITPGKFRDNMFLTHITHMKD